MARGWGCRWIFLTCEDDNAAARGLYQKCGYDAFPGTELSHSRTQCTRYPNFLPDGRVRRPREADLIVMAKRL